MKSYGRLIGIDVGTKRVGLARTDLLRASVNPAGTFSPEDSLYKIDSYHEEKYPVLAHVVGWPLSTSGTETSATRMADAFIKKLEKRYPDVPVFKVDERYSSKEAVQAMIRSGVPQKKRGEKGRVDQTAAALLLYYFLETNHDFE